MVVVLGFAPADFAGKMSFGIIGSSEFMDECQINALRVSRRFEAMHRMCDVNLIFICLHQAVFLSLSLAAYAHPLTRVLTKSR